MAVSVDKFFLSKLIEVADVKVFAECMTSIAPEMIKEPERGAYRFCIDYFNKYRKIPTFSILEDAFSASFFVECDAEIGFYSAEIINRDVYNKMTIKLGEIYPLMDRGKGIEALEKMNEGIKEISRSLTSPEEIKSLFSYGEDVWKSYERAKEGLSGISTPWKTLNDTTGGWQPEDLAMFVARSGLGKSWMLILLAKHAWEVEKKKVLFVSTELSNARILARFLSNHVRANYESMRRGKLGSMMESKMKDMIDRLMRDDDGRFKIVGKDFGSTLAALEKAIIVTEPELVIVDGVYLMERGNTRLEKHDRIAHVVDSMKGFGKKYGIPFIGASQLNRKASGKKDVKDDMLSFTDAFLMDSDYVFVMVQDVDMRADKIMNVQSIKVREGDVMDKMILKWDFENVDFGEIVVKTFDDEVPF